MTFANFIFVVFLLLSALIFVVLILLIRQIKKDGRLTPEKLSTLTALLFIPTIIVFGLIFKGISSWRSDIQYEKNQIEIETFVKGVYPPLANTRKSLRSDLLKMRTLLLDIETMELAHPNHLELIRQVKKQWQAGSDLLYESYNDADKEVRRAWIAHNTMNRQDVLDKFSKQAVKLVSQIKKSEKDYQTYIYSVQGKMTKALDRARYLLDSSRTPAKSKKQRAKNKATREHIQAFDSATTTELISYLSSIDPRLENELRTLQELVRLSGQQAAVTRDHLYQNEDLEIPLTKIINNWKNLANSSDNILQHILYAVEAEFVSRKLGLAADSPAIKAMHNSLRKNIPLIVGKGLKRRETINKSYNIKIQN